MENRTTPASKTPFEKFRRFTQKVVSVPKPEIDRREKKYKRPAKSELTAARYDLRRLPRTLTLASHLAAL
jgi:hypothetical protein